MPQSKAIKKGGKQSKKEAKKRKNKKLKRGKDKSSDDRQFDSNREGSESFKPSNSNVTDFRGNTDQPLNDLASNANYQDDDR